MSIRRSLVPLGLVICFFALGDVMLDLFTRSMLYPAPPVAVPASPPAPLEAVELELEDGTRVVAWASAADQVDARAPAVIFFHGNGENLETLRRWGFYDRLARLDVHFLAVDFPGYGRSGGRPSEESLTAAAVAGWAWLGRHRPEAPRVVLGWSLGAAVAIQVAARFGDEVDALILLSPWDDLPTLAKRYFPDLLVRAAVRDRYDSVQAAERVRAPTLVVHGTRDRIIPAAHGRRLHEALTTAGVAARWVEVATGHNDLFEATEVWEAIAACVTTTRYRSPEPTGDAL